jgi:aspartate kinase
MSGDVVVLKFGGTSLGSPGRVRRAARRIRAHRRRGWAVVAVVSAMGHATDRILRWAAEVAPGQPVAPVGGAVDDEAPRGTGWEREGAAFGRDLGRELDRALATGEDLSAALLALALTAIGVPARSLRGGEAGVWGGGAFGAGEIRRVDCGPIRRLLADGVVPVVSGFQAARDDGETVTLGRGGSDTSAVAIAAALGAARCDIVTDVDAVYDRDPRLDPAARRFESLDYASLVALAEGGAQVVHPAAARLAARYGVPLRVYAYRAPWRGGGTTIGEKSWEAA